MNAPTDELATLVQQAEAKAPEELTEEDKMALLGRPKAGDVVRAQLRIKESKEFKVSHKPRVSIANMDSSHGKSCFFLFLLKMVKWIVLRGLEDTNGRW